MRIIHYEYELAVARSARARRASSEELFHEMTPENGFVARWTLPGAVRLEKASPAGVTRDVFARRRFERLTARFSARDALTRRSSHGQTRRSVGQFLAFEFFVTLNERLTMLLVGGLMRGRDELAEECVQAFGIFRSFEDAIGDAE